MAEGMHGPIRLSDRGFDFRPHEVFETGADERDLLVPGLMVGCRVRYHWPEKRAPNFAYPDGGITVRSTQVYLRGIYTGEDQTEAVPHSKYHPTRNLHEVDLPRFDLRASRDGIHPQPIGTVSLAYMRLFESVVMYGTDHKAVARVLGTKPAENALPSYFGMVQPGSFFYAMPAGG